MLVTVLRALRRQDTPLVLLDEHACLDEYFNRFPLTSWKVARQMLVQQDGFLHLASSHVSSFSRLACAATHTQTAIPLVVQLVIILVEYVFTSTTHHVVCIWVRLPCHPVFSCWCALCSCPMQSRGIATRQWPHCTSVVSTSTVVHAEPVKDRPSRCLASPLAEPGTRDISRSSRLPLPRAHFLIQYAVFNEPS